MGTTHPFFMWSMAEAFDWLWHLPVLGFVLLPVILFLIGVVVLGVLASLNH